MLGFGFIISVDNPSCKDDVITKILYAELESKLYVYGVPVRTIFWSVKKDEPVGPDGPPAPVPPKGPRDPPGPSDPSSPEGPDGPIGPAIVGPIFPMGPLAPRHATVRFEAVHWLAESIY